MATTLTTIENYIKDGHFKCIGKRNSFWDEFIKVNRACLFEQNEHASETLSQKYTQENVHTDGIIISDRKSEFEEKSARIY